MSTAPASTTTAEPPPRRKWRIARWLAVLALAFAAYYGWKAYDFRAAVKEATMLGWIVEYDDPFDTVEKDWRAIFKRATWRSAAPDVFIRSEIPLTQDTKLLRRLDPRSLMVHDASLLEDLSILKGTSRLQLLDLSYANKLTNLDALKNHAALKMIRINAPLTLTNVDVLKHLTALASLELSETHSLTNLDALKNLPALESLVVVGSPKLTSIEPLKHVKTLKWLSLDGCTGITSLEPLKNHPTLEDFSIEGCTSLPEGARSALKATLPKAEAE